MFRKLLSGYARIPKGPALSFIFLFAHILAFSQKGDGKKGIEEATRLVTSYFSVGTTLAYGIGALVGIIGAIKVFNKWNSGDQDTAKAAASWFGSCIFLVVVGAVLSSFFGVK